MEPAGHRREQIDWPSYSVCWIVAAMEAAGHPRGAAGDVPPVVLEPVAAMEPAGHRREQRQRHVRIRVRDGGRNGARRSSAGGGSPRVAGGGFGVAAME